MSTYSTLAGDVKLLVPEFTASEFDDDDVARLLYRRILRLVVSAATVAPNHHLLPQSESTPSVPADLTSGFTIPSDLLRFRRMELRYSDNTREFVNIVEEQSRHDTIRPLPAAYLDPADGKVYPLPGNALLDWTDASLENAGWTDISTARIEYVNEPTDPGASGGSSSTNVAAMWEDVAVLAVAKDIARGLQSNRYQDIFSDHEKAENELYAMLGLGSVANMQKRIREVR